MQHLETWFGHGFGSTGLMVGLEDLTALFQPKGLYASNWFNSQLFICLSFKSSYMTTLVY